MPLMDTLRDGFEKIMPNSGGGRHTIPATTSGGGISSSQGIGHARFEDDMIISKPAIVFHSSQIFFNFLAMCCFASVAAFQAKWKIGPSGLSSFTLFVTILGMLIASFMLAVPVIYEKYDKLARLARMMKELRVGFILTGAGTTLSLIIAFTVTISAWTQPGCKDATKDPSANDDRGDDFTNALPGWCSTKKAAAIFLWLDFGFWAASLGLLIWEWRKGGGRPSFKHGRKPQDPPFTAPVDHEAVHSYDEDEDDSPSAIPQPTSRPQDPFSDTNRYSAARPTSGYASPPSGGGRQSMDVYGAFQDSAPSGYSPGGYGGQSGYTGYQGTPSSTGYAPPVLPEPDLGPQVGGGMSRTMAYAAEDPYAKVKATIHGGTTPPGGYNGYNNYRMPYGQPNVQLQACTRTLNITRTETESGNEFFPRMPPRVSEKRKQQLLEARKARHNKDLVAPSLEELEQTNIGKAEKRAVAAEAEAAKLKKEVENYKKEAANARRRDERHKAAKEAWDKEKQALKKDIEAARGARETSNLAVQEGSILGV